MIIHSDNSRKSIIHIYSEIHVLSICTKIPLLTKGCIPELFATVVTKAGLY